MRTRIACSAVSSWWPSGSRWSGSPCFWVADHRLPASDPVGNESQQRASDHPAERDRGGDPDRVLVLAPSSFLQEAHAPRHVEDRRRDESKRADVRSEEHTSELQSQSNLVCRLLLEKKK